MACARAMSRVVGALPEVLPLRNRTRARLSSVLVPSFRIGCALSDDGTT